MYEVVHTEKGSIIRGSRPNKWVPRMLYAANCAGAAFIVSLVLFIVCGAFDVSLYVSRIIGFFLVASIVGYIVGMILFFSLGLLLPREDFEERIDRA